MSSSINQAIQTRNNSLCRKSIRLLGPDPGLRAFRTQGWDIYDHSGLRTGTSTIILTSHMPLYIMLMNGRQKRSDKTFMKVVNGTYDLTGRK
jgi:hypothetical protein